MLVYLSVAFLSMALHALGLSLLMSLDLIEISPGQQLTAALIFGITAATLSVTNFFRKHPYP